MNSSITAIILAAGYSSRMGSFKPLLPFGNGTVLERAVYLFRGVGIQDIRVVVGHRSDELLPLLERLQVRPLLNERYQDGMFSSVVTAVESLEKNNGAFFLLPVDIPLVRQETVEMLINTFRSGNKGILYPGCHGRAGHPPLISSLYRDQILTWKGSGGLKSLLAEFEEDSSLVETGDEGVLLDMDTPQDYERLRCSLQNSRVPSREVCEQLLSERFAADSPVVEHCRTVARLAHALTVRLNERGCQLDPVLIESAALLHDLAKGEPHHAAAGAAALKRMGYPAVAELVACHMELTPRCDNAVDAAELLFLADKLVEGDRIVPLETRFRRQLERHADNRQILTRIMRRLECARSILRRVEHRLGIAVSDLVMVAHP
jgi:CTP:molybdopterin cytidylyltransferase MocA/HD superfamily phosphohydrolase YqeK